MNWTRLPPPDPNNPFIKQYIKDVKGGRRIIRRLIKEGKLSKNATLHEIGEAIEKDRSRK